MKTKIEYKRFFAYSNESKKCFYTKFGSDVNIVYGKNTSGKSTLLQAINYTFGVNDERYKLTEILDQNVIFRLDFIRTRNRVEEKVSIVRDTDFIYIKQHEEPIKKFSGISSDHSAEHVYLKRYIADLLGVNLFLESSGDYKLASIEAMLLPYYVAQDYGWVITLKSFRGLGYFKNFKNDYYDYYLGIFNEYDRNEKQRLELLKKEYESEIRFLNSCEHKKTNLKLSVLKDERFVKESANYLTSFKNEKISLIENEKKYILLSNEVRFLEERKNILNRIKRAVKGSVDCKCPTCHQKLPNSVAAIYESLQNIDDTKAELVVVNEQIKSKTGLLHTAKKTVGELQAKISKNYAALQDYNVDGMTMGSWINDKTNTLLTENIVKQVGEYQIKLNDTMELLAEYKTDEQIQKERANKDTEFQIIFNKALKDLGVNNFGEKYSLYKMPLFPQQGVELLKTLLAYNISFNKVIKTTEYVHRLPLVMDAIFKEDVDENSREQILKYISLNRPKDTQILFSIADSKTNSVSAEGYNRRFFSNSANMILINKSKERSFLRDYTEEYKVHIERLMKMIESD